MKLKNLTGTGMASVNARALPAAVALAAALLAATTARAEAPLSVGMSVGTLGNPFFVAAAKGALDEAKQSDPNARVTTVSSDYDLNKQFTQIDNFGTSGTKLILLNAVDPRAIGSAIKRAQASGAVVAAFDVGAAGADVTAMTDNVKAGQMSCQYLADKLGGKGNVIIINGPQVTSVTDRVKGCKEVLGRYKDISILSDNQDGKGSREGGLGVAQNLLSRFPRVDGIFSINEEQAIGADLAARQLQRREMVMTTVDGSPDGINNMKSPTSLIVATAAQNPYEIARTAVRLGIEAVKGHRPAEPTVLLQPVLVTRDNVSDYKGWVNQ